MCPKPYSIYLRGTIPCQQETGTDGVSLGARSHDACEAIDGGQNTAARVVGRCT